jgi:hypothetical protein
MRLWIFFLVLFLIFIYLISSIIFVALTNFWFQDKYLDEDLIYQKGRPDWVPKDAFVIDIHSHTRASDGLLTPKQSILWHISNGFDGVVISDHNTMASIKEAQKIAHEIAPNFLIIPGVEFTSMRSHLNLIGVKTPMKIPRQLWTRKKTIIAAIEHAHSEGGVVQFNHRDWYPHKRYLPKQWYLENGIDGFEVFNGFGFFDDEALDFIEENRNKKIMFPSSGTDVHDPAKHILGYTELLTDDRSVEGVVQALKEGKSVAHFSPDWKHKENRPEKGKKQLNPERSSFIRKWWLLNWPGYAIVEGKHTRLLIVFILFVLICSLILSFF